jgi:hypothetical protein
MSSNEPYWTTSVLKAPAARVVVAGFPGYPVLLGFSSSSHGTSSESSSFPYVGVSIAIVVVDAVEVSVQGVEVSVGVTTVPLSTVIVVGAPSDAVVVVALAELDEAPSAGMTPGPTTLIGGTGPVDDAAGGAGAAFAGVSTLPPPVAGILDDPITRMGGTAPLEELAAGAEADDVDASLVDEATCELSPAAPLEMMPTPITLIGAPAAADELAGDGVAEADAPTLVAPITLT